MKRKTFILRALLPLMCLASCKDNVFSYGKLDLSKDYILYKTMDAVSKSYSTGELSYKTKFRYADIYEVIEAVEYGEDVLLLFYGEECHSCQEVIPSLIKDIAYLQLTIFVVENNTSGSASTLNRYIAEKGIEKVTSTVINGGTPSLYLLNNKKITEVFYGSKGEKTTDVVIRALKEYTTCCGLIYGSASAGRKGDAEIPTYIFDKNNQITTDFYYENIFSLAEKSNKKFQVLDVTKVEKESTKESIIHHFLGDSPIDDSGWGLDSFDGWIVSCEQFAGQRGSVGYKIERHHYSDSATKTWLKEYFNN